MLVYHVNDQLHVVVEMEDEHVVVSVGYRSFGIEIEKPWNYRQIKLVWVGESLLHHSDRSLKSLEPIIDASQRRKLPD